VKKSQKEIYIQNTFLDLLCFLLSYIVNIFRGIKMFFSLKRSSNIKKSISFQSTDYFLRIWPKYFWSSPTMLKLTRIVGDFIHYVFLKK